MKRFLFFLLLLSFTGCIYYPALSDIPLLENKNDLVMDAGIPGQATISYAMTDKLSVQGFANSQSFQGSIGYYRSWDRAAMQIYGGYAYGRGNATGWYEAGVSIRGKYHLPFLQTNYLFICDDFCNLGAGIKTGYLNSDLTYYNDQFSEDYKDHSISIEPRILFKAGGKKLKISAQFSLPYIHKLTNKEKKFPSLPMLGVGLNYRFGGKKEK